MPQVTDPLVLPSDVVLRPVAELPEDIRLRINCAQNDIAVTRPLSRTPSKVVDAETADLIGLFRSPKTIAEAVIEYCGKRSRDPQQILGECFPLIQQFVNEQLLLPNDSVGKEAITAKLNPGDELGVFTISHCIQVLADTELYQARRRGDGAVVALKVTRRQGGVLAARILAHEARILKGLDGEVNPTLIDLDVVDDRGYLALSWCEGISAAALASELRQAETGSRGKLLELCGSILRAYAHLHAQSVLHADIHPGNILIDAAGKIWLIDFGLARDLNATMADPHRRGGVAFFFDPEYASTQCNASVSPVIEAAGEQYSLSALLYQLITGIHYLDFSLEQEEMLRQICKEPPLAFAAQGLAPWPEVEQVLFKALSKKPQDRFGDVSEFAQRLATARSSFSEEPSARERRATKPSLQASGETLISECLRRVDFDGLVFVDGLQTAPTASLTYGTAGIAYMLYRVAGVRSDPSLLALADIWATRAIGEIDKTQGFYNPEIEITPETVGHISPYHTPSGIHAVRTLIAGAMGDRLLEQEALRAFVDATRGVSDSLDLTLGQSSLLVSGALLVESLHDHSLVETSGLAKMGDDALLRIWSEIGRYRPISEQEEINYLGMAHGWAGILYATLRWCQVRGSTPPRETEKRLRQLADLAELTGRGARWPWHLEGRGSTYMPGWCNGSAGYVFLWTLAHRVLKHEFYFRLAQKAVWNAWEDQASAASLCCGYTGRAYAALRWYNHSGDESWLQRAYTLADHAASHIRAETTADATTAAYVNSLFKGEVGTVALLADLQHPKTAALPFFESERDLQ